MKNNFFNFLLVLFMSLFGLAAAYLLSRSLVIETLSEGVQYRHATNWLVVGAALVVIIALQIVLLRHFGIIMRVLVAAFVIGAAVFLPMMREDKKLIMTHNSFSCNDETFYYADIVALDMIRQKTEGSPNSFYTYKFTKRDGTVQSTDFTDICLLENKVLDEIRARGIPIIKHE